MLTRIIIRKLSLEDRQTEEIGTEILPKFMIPLLTFAVYWPKSYANCTRRSKVCQVDSSSLRSEVLTLFNCNDSYIMTILSSQVYHNERKKNRLKNLTIMTYRAVLMLRSTQKIGRQMHHHQVPQFHEDQFS